MKMRASGGKVHFLCFRACDRWKDIGTIAHNKAAITVEITSRDDTIVFHMVSVVSFHEGVYRGDAVLIFYKYNRLWYFKMSMFVPLCAGGYGNGQVRRSPFHGQAQILQTEQDLCRVSQGSRLKANCGTRNLKSCIVFLFHL